MPLETPARRLTPIPMSNTVLLPADPLLRGKAGELPRAGIARCLDTRRGIDAAVLDDGRFLSGFGPFHGPSRPGSAGHSGRLRNLWSCNDSPGASSSVNGAVPQGPQGDRGRGPGFMR